MDSAFFSWICDFLLARSSLMETTFQDLLLFHIVQNVGVWPQHALLKSANESDKGKWDWRGTQQNSAVPQFEED